jgi:hypothetical protein
LECIVYIVINIKEELVMDKLYNFTEYVKASSIWSGEKDYEDKGPRSGLVRGYNVELTNREGKTFWLSCCYIESNPREYFNAPFHRWYFQDNGWTPTGRICFRGYGISYYDTEANDYCVRPVED